MKDEKIKTAEEILNEFIGGSSVFGKSFRKTCLAAMNKYASQFQSSPKKECGLPSKIYENHINELEKHKDGLQTALIKVQSSELEALKAENERLKKQITKDDVNFWVQRAAEYAIELKELKDRMEWISVETKLPECYSQHNKDYGSGYLLGCTKYNEIVIIQLWNNKEWDIEGEMEELSYITHYMPLPLPPTKIK